MKFINRLLSCLILALLVQGCSRPGSSSVDSDESYQYNFIAEDAKLIGLTVIDNADVVATEVQPGVYEFPLDYMPVTPVSFRSQNAIQDGLTFQDVDGSGDKTAADIPYNVGFEIVYLGSFITDGDRQLFANPLTALIPAEGIPSSGIAGLPAEIFNIAISQGVDNAPGTEITLPDGTIKPANELIKQSVVMLTAIQESVISLQGNSRANQSNIVRLLAELRDADLSSGLDDPSQLATVIQGAVEIALPANAVDVVLQVTDSLGDTVVNTTPEDLTYYESIVAMVQTEIDETTTADSVQNVINGDSLSQSDESLVLGEELQKEIEESGGISAFLASLHAVPIHIEGNSMSLVDDSVTEFNIEYVQASENIILHGTGAFFDEAELPFNLTAGLYGTAVDDTHAVIIGLNINSTNFLNGAADGVNSARLMALCWKDEAGADAANVCGAENANLEFYALATEAEICGSTFADILTDMLLTEINMLNSSEISCSG